MPFPDEIEPGGVVVSCYRPEWQTEFAVLADRLRGVLGFPAGTIDHIGSTSVPGLAAKDCIDVQVRVDRIDAPGVVPLFEAAGFRMRPESWNRVETSGGIRCTKLVFAPPMGSRPCNVHVRSHTGANTRFALLFRDFLRADRDARDAWGAFKQRLARSVPSLADYGQIKAPATDVLMIAAERWAAATRWSPTGDL